MDVNQALFWGQLIPVMRSISRAAFVTIDVEMGGISTRRAGGNDRSHSQAKPTLQQQYEETKEAAETYQVLQIGITCVEEDLDKEMYFARPYNFNVSPLFLQGDKLEIHRDITLSSSAVHFLMRNSFDIGAVFTKGVTYLSREEEASALQNYVKRQESQSTIPDIVIPPSDVEAQKFYDKAKKTVSEWFGKEQPYNNTGEDDQELFYRHYKIASSILLGGSHACHSYSRLRDCVLGICFFLTKEIQPATDFVNIGCYGGLNGYQRRLVHQLIRNEFKGYRTFARSGGEFMQVEKTDQAREAQMTKVKLQAFESGLAKQIGLRFIIEALVGGDLTRLDPNWFCVNESGDPTFTNVGNVKKELEELKDNLKKKPQVLVGHNLFTDLIFLYKTFIGSLPDTVTEFNNRIHALFPCVIDTKYLATHEGGSMQTKSTLKNLCADLKDRKIPLTALAENHTAYDLKDKEHEAGFDSWMTAQVLVKLSSKLAAEKNVGADAGANGDMVLKTKASTESLINGDVVLNPPDTNGLSQGVNMKLKGLDKKNSGVDNSGYEFDSRQKMGSQVVNQSPNGNLIDILTVEGSNDEGAVFLSVEETDGGVPLNSAMELREPSLLDSDFDDGFKLVLKKKSYLRAQVPYKSIAGPGDLSSPTDGTSYHLQVAQVNKYAVLDPEKQKLEDKLSKWMPDFKSPFWKPYINRLRVYGTEDEICHLGN